MTNGTAAGSRPRARDAVTCCPGAARKMLSLRYLEYGGGIPVARKYGKKAGRKVKRAMHQRKKGSLRSGRSGKRVKSRKQAIAIGLSEARRSGAKVPRKRKGRKKK